MDQVTGPCAVEIQGWENHTVDVKKVRSRNRKLNHYGGMGALIHSWAEALILGHIALRGEVRVRASVLPG